MLQVCTSTYLQHLVYTFPGPDCLLILAECAMPVHREALRGGLKTLFEDPLLEANKMAREVLLCSFGTDSFSLPVLDIDQNPNLAAVAALKMVGNNVIWEDRTRHKMGGRSILIPVRTAGQATFLDFLGK
jgi:hypothetical protein